MSHRFANRTPSESGTPKPGHHPFTRPHPDDIDKLESDPMHVRSRAYDLVLNGWELGSGSVRIHRGDVQQQIFQSLGMSDEEAHKRFGFFLDALEYGTPPHGGIAFGLDRLIMLLAGRTNLRETIAFPKTASATDLLTAAPSPVDIAQLQQLHIRTVAKAGSKPAPGTAPAPATAVQS